jgi:hypothetical protein
VTDSRYADYLAKYGAESWELDALTPTYIVDLVRRELEALIDRKTFDAAKRKQEKDRALLNRSGRRLAYVGKDAAKTAKVDLGMHGGIRRLELSAGAKLCHCARYIAAFEYQDAQEVVYRSGIRPAL